MFRIQLDKEALRKALDVLVEPLSIEHILSTFELGENQEITLTEVKNKTGLCIVFFQGDGDGNFIVRVRTDGKNEDEFKTNEKRLGFYVFSSSFSISLYNPQVIMTASSSSFILRGLIRPK
jgi:hypothetical protein